MVVSWRSLLNSMATRTRAAGEPPGIEADIGQLSGLARRKNDEAFVPFSDEYVELGAMLEERRRLDFQRLVNDATERGVEAGWADKGRIERSQESARLRAIPAALGCRRLVWPKR